MATLTLRDVTTLPGQWTVIADGSKAFAVDVARERLWRRTVVKGHGMRPGACLDEFVSLHNEAVVADWLLDQKV